MATISDIAKEAKVSVSTVSRILNNDTNLNVSDVTRTKVFNIANKLGYKKSKRKNKANKTFAIIQWYTLQQEIEDPYFLSIRQGAEAYCIEHNIDIIRIFKDDKDWETKIKKVNGIICIGIFSIDEINKIKNINSNIIVLDMYNTNLNAHTINLDFEQAIDEELSYLLDNNINEIAYIGGIHPLIKKNNIEEPRQKYLKAFCDKNNIKSIIYEGDFSIESGYILTNDLINKHFEHMPQAIIAASDPIAIGALRALQENDFNIPNDIWLIGFDNIEASYYTTPPLTTMDTPAFIMGRYGAQIIDIFKSQSIPMHIKLPCKLIIRNTTK